MTDRTIPQRELRNRISAVLRATASGETFIVTVRGKPVARLVPPSASGEPHVDVDRQTIRRILALAVDDELADDLEAAEAAVDDPWRAV